MPAPRPVLIGSVTLPPGLLAGAELSGVSTVGDTLVLVSNETTAAQLLVPDGGGYRVAHTVTLADSDDELDLEGVAVDGRTVYVCGSHSRVRKVDAPGELPRRKVKPKPARDGVYRFKVSDAGDPGRVRPASLRGVIDADPILADFVPLASKENGVDVEGLAVKDWVLYFGFRGPVLRDNWVPVVVAAFGAGPGAAETRYVKLGGRGVRDLATVSDGFLVLAGPPGDQELSFQVFHWDGRSLADATSRGVVTLLAEFDPAPDEGNPEGITVVAETPAGYELLLVRDGATAGDLSRWRVIR